MTIYFFPVGTGMGGGVFVKLLEIKPKFGFFSVINVLFTASPKMSYSLGNIISIRVSYME